MLGFLGLRDLPAQTLIGDAHEQVGRRHLDVDLDRDRRVVPAAVLDGVHRRLADGGLESLEARLGERQRLDGLGDPVHGHALVALLAGDDEVEEALVCAGGIGVGIGVRGGCGPALSPQCDHA